MVDAGKRPEKTDSPAKKEVKSILIRVSAGPRPYKEDKPDENEGAGGEPADDARIQQPAMVGGTAYYGHHEGNGQHGRYEPEQDFYQPPHAKAPISIPARQNKQLPIQAPPF